jgi:hypothetical protein
MSDSPARILFDVSGSQVGTAANPFVISASFAPPTVVNNVFVGGTNIISETEASYLVLSNTSSLSNERVLTPGTGLHAIDGGANSSYTLLINDNVVATVSGTTFTGPVSASAGLSGSLQQVAPGLSYLVAGSNIIITSASNGQVTITSMASGSGITTFAAVSGVLGSAPGAVSFNNQDLDNVGKVNGIRIFPPSSSDPTSPTPAAGDQYFNTLIGEQMMFDGIRGKFLSTSQISIFIGAAGATITGSYFRGADGMAFGNYSGIPLPKGTIVGLSATQSGNTNPKIEVVLSGSTTVAILEMSGSGMSSNWSLNGDFNEGLLQFKNKLDGALAFDIQITALIKRRA